MVFLHMSMSSKRMMDTYTRMIRTHFPTEEHRFLYCDRLTDNDEELLNYGNSTVLSGNTKSRFRQMCKEMDAADVIIWHGLLFGVKRVLILTLFKKYRKKSVWIMRGLDLYNWKSNSAKIKYKVFNAVNFLTRKMIPYAGAIFPTDKGVYQRAFGKKGKVFDTPYPFSEHAFDMMDNFDSSVARPNGVKYLQVAHNAYTFNDHLRILDSIKHFSGENIRVVVPLSYGNDWYNKEEDYYKTVKKKAEEYFGKKAYCLKRLMPPTEYDAVVSNMDICLYGSKRQNALGNILRSLYQGNKVFLPQDNPMYPLFRGEGIDIYPLEEVADMSFEEFAAPVNTTAARKWIRERFHPDNNYHYWDALFSYFKGVETTEVPVKKDEEVSMREKKPVKIKSNYLYFDKYMESPRGTDYNAIKNVMIIGSGAVSEYVCRKMLEENAQGLRWAIYGILDPEKTLLENPIGEHQVDIVGSFDDIQAKDDLYYVNAMDTMEDRKRVVQILKERNCKSISYLPEGSNYGAPLDDKNVVCIGDVNMSGGTKIGEGCLICGGRESLHVGICLSAEIGDYCKIEYGCVIGENVHIGNQCVIGAFSRIAPGVRIADNTVIPAYSVVTEDIL